MPSPRLARPDVAAIEALFSRERMWRAFLDIEATLAEVQAELGMIPATAAAEIHRDSPRFTEIERDRTRSTKHGELARPQRAQHRWPACYG